MTYELRLYRDHLAPGAWVPMSGEGAAIAASYVVSGSVRTRSRTAAAAFSPNSAFHLAERAEMAASSPSALVLRWELASEGAAPSLQARGDSTTQIMLREPLALDPQGEYLLRCDRVDFPAGGVALLHTHRGGGIRCLLTGSIEIDTRGSRHCYGPLEGWFEAGPDPVFATASKSEPSAFVRLMILPRDLLGKSSISYVNADDLPKPKSQSYQIFLDTPIELPRL